MIYTLKFEKKVMKFLGELSTKNLKLVLTKIEVLKSDPKPSGFKQLIGYDKTFRIRAGNFRIIYEINHGELVILIVSIDDRKDVYN